MSILAVMVPACIMAATEETVRFCYRKANEQLTIMSYKHKVRERRSRSQRRWA